MSTTYFEFKDEADTGASLFVGSLKPSTTEKVLSNYFSNFGQIDDVKIITDRISLRSKWCALVFCSDLETLMSIVDQDIHVIDGKIVRVDFANQEKKGTKIINT